MKKILVFLILIIFILLRFAFSIRTADIFENEIYKLKFEVHDGRANIFEINNKFPTKKVYANFYEKEDGEYEGYFSIIQKKEYKGINFVEIKEIHSEKIEKNFLKNYLEKIFEESQENFSYSLKNMNRAILLGDSSRMSKEIKEKIRYIGLSHLFAMSGFHISIIFFITYFIFGKIFSKKKTIEFSVLIFISLYFFSIKNSPSFTRAYIMLVIYLLGSIFYEKIDAKKSLWISAIISILYRPNVIYSISFQLSYLAMIAILYIYPIIRKNYRKIQFKKIYLKENKILDYFMMTIIIQIFLSPLLIYYFSTFPFLAMIFNAFLIPIASLYIVINYISLFLANFHLSFLISYFVKIVYRVFTYFIDLLSEIPHLSIETENEFINSNIIYIYLILGILFCLKYCWREFYENSKKRV